MATPLTAATTTFFGLVQPPARYDNMVTYQTPDVRRSVKATVQYSFNEDSVTDKDREGSSAVEPLRVRRPHG